MFLYVCIIVFDIRNSSYIMEATYDLDACTDNLVPPV